MSAPLIGAVLLACQAVNSAEFGAQAPANCWYTEGGSAARTAVSLTAPLRGVPERAWEYAGRGPLVGEPLVWQELVIVEEHEDDERRNLLVLDLLTGEVVARERFQTPVPLQPTLWNRVVVVRSAPRQLAAIRVYPGALKTFHRWDCSAEVYDPLLVEGFVFARLADELVGLRLWQNEPLWTRRGAFRGRISLRGDLLYAVDYAATGMGRLVTLDWRTGEVQQALDVAHHNGRRPSRVDELAVAVLDRWVFVDHALPIPTQDGDVASATVTERLPGRPLRLKAGGVVRAPGRVAAWDGGWLGQLVMDGPENLLLRVRDLEHMEPLASADHHPEFLADPSLPSLARNVAYFGASAIDLDSSRILWHLDASPTTRLVPARETLLFVEGDRRLVALRAREDPARAPRFLEVPAGDEPLRGRVVLRDGTVVRGAFSFTEVDREPWHVRGLSGWQNGKRARWTLGDLLWLEGDDGRVYFASSDDDRLAGLHILVERQLAQEYTELADAATSAGDPVLLERLLAEATRRGAEDWQTIAGAEERLRRYEELVQAGRPPRISERRVESIRRREEGFAARPAAELWQRVREIPDSAPWDLRVDLLRAVLEADPAHAEARGLVKGMLPRGVQVPERFDALDWLDFVESLRQTPIEFVTAPAAGQEPSLAQQELLAARKQWREDLVGVASPSLLVITPLRYPGRIARCLALGELVCDTLESMFQSGQHRRDERQPLKLYLYETEQEYREQSRIPVESLEWTAGHYSLTENVERIFLPHDADAFDAVMNTYAHELTHHWMAERCPRFRGRDLLRMRPDQPGFWVVEGFASLLESFDYDLRTWQARPRALPESLDLVVNARPDQRLPWSAVFELTHEQFGSLERHQEVPIAMTEYLGIGRSVSQTGMFYVQAEAACQALFHADGGRHREALLKFIGDYYSGRREGLDVQAAFGMTPTELGKQVEAHARRLQGASLASGGR